MKKQVRYLALSTLFGVGVALAMPQAQDQSSSAAPSAAAQTDQSQAHRAADPNQQIKRLTKRLNLSAEQQSQILPILTDRQQQMNNLRADNTLSPTDRREKFRSLRTDSDNKIRAILNDQQKKAYDEMQQRMHDRTRNRRQSAQGTGAQN